MIFKFKLKIRRGQKLKQLLSSIDLTAGQNKTIHLSTQSLLPGNWHRQKYIDSSDIGRTSDKTSIFFFSPFKSVQCRSPVTFMCPINAMQRLWWASIIKVFNPLAAITCTIKTSELGVYTEVRVHLSVGHCG